MNLRHLLLIFALVLCAACMKSMGIRDQADRLSTALDHYGADLRWGRYSQAYAYHINREGERPQVNLDRMEGFSITSFTPAEPVLNADATEAVIPVEIQYYEKQYAMLRTLKETQKWWFDAKKNAWYVESDFPTLK